MNTEQVAFKVEEIDQHHKDLHDPLAESAKNSCT
jgi:hypothetical protein